MDHDRRIQLHEILCGILGSRYVYFQPPENIKMVYPCIVYTRSNMHKQYASNKTYYKKNCYTVTVIDKRPDSPIFDRVAELSFCSFDRQFVNDQLNHCVFQLYF